MSSMAVTAVSIAAIAAVGGGVVYGARTSEEGDLLFPLKAYVGTDAEVESDTDVDVNLGNAKAQYEEAMRLQAEGSLSADVKARLDEVYEENMRRVALTIESLEEKGDMQAAARVRTELRTALRNYDDIFGNVKIGIESSAESTIDSSMEEGTDSSTDDDSARVEADSETDTSVEVDADEGSNVNVESSTNAESTVRINQN